MLNKYNLIISPLAKKDLNSIYDYVWLDLYSKISASKLINDFYKAFDTISYFPKSFPVIDNEFLSSEILRKVVVRNYIILYYFENDTITIVRIVYGARDYENIVKKID
mgnify:CR=1 FL=1